jgi:hypothetical protein
MSIVKEDIEQFERSYEQYQNKEKKNKKHHKREIPKRIKSHEIDFFVNDDEE